jgi:glycosyltransferase involved in cell wall biosynthesis
MKNKINILFIDSGAGQGGSMSYLISFLNYLNREKFNPLVALYYYSDAPKLKFLQNQGIEVVFISPGRKKKERIWNSRIYSIWLLKKLVVCFRIFSGSIVGKVIVFLRFVKLIYSKNIDLVFFGSDVAYNFPCILAAKILRKKCIVRKSGWGTVRKLSKTRFIFSKLVDIYIASSEAELSAHQSNKLPYKRIVRIYEGVDLHSFLPAVPSGKIRKEFGIEPNIPVVCSVSRIDEGKGHLDLLKAAKLVIKNDPRVIFLIVGDDFDFENGYLKKELLHEVSVMGIKDNVIFAGWREDVRDILKEIDIFVHCPNEWREGMSIATLEALASGKPAVITSNWGLAETVIDGYNGFHVPIGDFKKLSDRIMILTKNKNLILQMGNNARAYSEKMFDIAKNAAETEKLILELLKKERKC